MAYYVRSVHQLADSNKYSKLSVKHLPKVDHKRKIKQSGSHSKITVKWKIIEKIFSYSPSLPFVLKGKLFPKINFYKRDASYQKEYDFYKKSQKKYFNFVGKTLMFQMSMIQYLASR